MSDLCRILREDRVPLIGKEGIFSAKLSKGVLACIWSKKSAAGGAIFLTKPAALKEAMQSLLRSFEGEFGRRSDIEAKVLCVDAPVSKHFAVAGINKINFIERHAANEAKLQAYFYPASGRFRVAGGAKKTRILVIDDSQTVCRLLKRLFETDPLLEVVGCVNHPACAQDMIASLEPDVITLDINMPETDGVTLLKRYLPHKPIPTIMISALSMADGNQVLEALEAGAVDYIQKPSLGELDTMGPDIIEKVKSASKIKVASHGTRMARLHRQESPVIGSFDNFETIIAIGASTGGTEAIGAILRKLPEKIPPIVVVQHIPPVFSKAFADRLNGLCPFEVKEAEDGDVIKPNRVLVAPGGFQMEIQRLEKGYAVRLTDDPPVNRHKPSVDVLFKSVSKTVKAPTVGVILTGMGADGAKGLLQMRETGSTTLAQDEKSCVVFGMPREAIQLGAAGNVAPLDDIPELLMVLAAKKRKAA